jgi:hypothetical protein
MLVAQWRRLCHMFLVPPECTCPPAADCLGVALDSASLFVKVLHGQGHTRWWHEHVSRVLAAASSDRAYGTCCWHHLGCTCLPGAHCRVAVKGLRPTCFSKCWQHMGTLVAPRAFVFSLFRPTSDKGRMAHVALVSPVCTCPVTESCWAQLEFCRARCSGAPQKVLLWGSCMHTWRPLLRHSGVVYVTCCCRHLNAPALLQLTAWEWHWILRPCL